MNQQRFLTIAELEYITKAVRPSAMQKRLDEMGIPFRPRIDGYPMVYAEDCSLTRRRQGQAKRVNVEAIRNGTA